VTSRGAAYLVLAAAALGAACTSRTPPRNVVLITLDTMRADRLPAYGFDAVATPALDRLAAEGAVFERAFAAVPLTLPSHATLFTGLYPPRLSVYDNAGAPLGAEAETLAEVLASRGLATAAFVSSAVIAPGRGLEQGPHVSDGLRRKWSTSRSTGWKVTARRRSSSGCTSTTRMRRFRCLSTSRSVMRIRILPRSRTRMRRSPGSSNIWNGADCSRIR
jgi:hypothetical protein